MATNDDVMAAARERAKTLHNAIGMLIGCEYGAIVKEHVPVLRARLAKHVPQFQEVMHEFRGRRARAVGIVDDVAGLFDDADEVRATIREFGASIEPLANVTAANVVELCEALPSDAELLRHFEADQARWYPIGQQLFAFIQQPADDQQQAIKDACQRYGSTGGKNLIPRLNDDEQTSREKPKGQPRQMTWQKIKTMAENYVKNHNDEFPGRNALAKILGITRSTLSTAIKRSSYLNARQAEHNQKRGGRAIQNLSKIDLDQTAQTTEPDPQAKALVMNELIDEQAKEITREDRQHQASKKKARRRNTQSWS